MVPNRQGAKAASARAAEEFASEVDKAVEALRRRAQAEKVLDEARRRMGGQVPFGQQAAGMAGQIGMARSGNVAGLLGGAATMAGGSAMLATAAIGAFEQALKGATGALNIYQNAALTNAQKTRALLDEWVPLAKTMREFAEAVDGTTETLRANQVRLQKEMFGQGVDLQAQQQRAGYFREREAARSRAGALGAAQLPGLPLINRSTLEGERTFERQQALRPGQLAEMRGKAELEAARRDEKYASSEIEKIDKQLAARRAERARANDEAERLKAVENSPLYRKKAARDTALGEASKAGDAITKLEEQRQERITQLKDAQVRSATAESQIRKSLVEQSKAELDLLRQKEQRALALDAGLGSMNPVQRQQALFAARFAKEYGIGNTPAELQGMIGQVAPDWLRKQREQFGGMTEEAAALRAEGFVDKETLQEIREQVNKAQTKVEVDVQLDEVKLAEAVAEALERSVGKLIASIDALVADQKRKFADDLDKRRNMEN